MLSVLPNGLEENVSDVVRLEFGDEAAVRLASATNLLDVLKASGIVAERRDDALFVARASQAPQRVVVPFCAVTGQAVLRNHHLVVRVVADTGRHGLAGLAPWNDATHRVDDRRPRRTADIRGQRILRNGLATVRVATLRLAPDLSVQLVVADLRR